MLNPIHPSPQNKEAVFVADKEQSEQVSEEGETDARWPFFLSLLSYYTP